MTAVAGTAGAPVACADPPPEAVGFVLTLGVPPLLATDAATMMTAISPMTLTIALRTM
jgi:hypothetical protein